jgi:hypothetical protein
VSDKADPLTIGFIDKWRVRSVIPAGAIRLYYLNPSTLSNNRSLAASLAVVCTQIQLGYGVMAASVTVLKPFMVVYEKPLGYTDYSHHPAALHYATNNSEHLSFKMRPPARSSASLPNGELSRPLGFDTSQPTYSSRSPAPLKDKLGNGVGYERSVSMHSHDSQRLIIERKTAWSIRYEEEERHKSNASGTAGSV